MKKKNFWGKNQIENMQSNWKYAIKLTKVKKIIMNIVISKIFQSLIENREIFYEELPTKFFVLNVCFWSAKKLKYIFINIHLSHFLMNAAKTEQYKKEKIYKKYQSSNFENLQEKLLVNYKIHFSKCQEFP